MTRHLRNNSQDAAELPKGNGGTVIPKRLPLGSHLVIFTAVLLVPILFFAGILLWEFSKSERARYEQDALETARRLSAVVDRELSKFQGALVGLSTTRQIDLNNQKELFQQAMEVSRFIGSVVVIKDTNGQQLVNTRLGFGATLPVSLPEGDREALEKRATTITGLFSGSTAGRAIVSINVPIVRGDRIIGLINTGLFPERLANIIREQGVPDTWIAAIIDRNGKIIARSRQHEEFTGKSASADLLAATTGQEGVWTGMTATGEPVLAAYVRSELTGWRIAVGVPVAVVQELLNRSLLWLLGLGAAALVIYGIIARFLGERMAQPLRSLATAAGSLGTGEIIQAPPSRISEVSNIGDSLVKASQTLRLRAEERDHAERALRELNDNLETIVTERTSQLVESNQKVVAEILQRETVEQQLRQSQKMEAVGQLTGGIAHDFNNLLAIITGSLQMLQRRLDKGETGAIQRYVDSASEGANRAVTLIQRLLAFARQQPLTPEAIDGNKLLSGMSDLLRRSLGESIRIETVLAGGLWRTHADPNQLENAILNLALNARDAMPDGGKLTIETANCDLDLRYAGDNPGVLPGQYVMIAVTDTGVGISADKQAQAFDPFYTTKPAGHGTGLGLSQVYGFVRQTGGHVKLYSEVGQGTTVKLYLPRFTGPDLRDPDVSDIKTSPKLARGSETILVVEDEDGVRRLSVEALHELGYEVLEADGAPAALRLIDARPDISLLFTDVVMPEVNGRKLADEALRRRPQLKVLFTSGYTRTAVVHNGVLDPGVQLLAKPFTFDELAARVRQVLDGSRVDS